MEKLVLYAQPYSLDAEGFYFSDMADYDKKYSANRDSFGGLVEEYEIQMIDGRSIDIAFGYAVGVNQANLPAFFEAVDSWSDYELVRAALAHNEGIASSCFGTDASASDYDNIIIYEDMTFEELAEQFVDDGHYGEIPEPLVGFIDYKQIAHELQHSYSETKIAGTYYIYQAD